MIKLRHLEAGAEGCDTQLSVPSCFTPLWSPPEATLSSTSPGARVLDSQTGLYLSQRP